jgi:hypothetical protein
MTLSPLLATDLLKTTTIPLLPIPQRILPFKPIPSHLIRPLRFPQRQELHIHPRPILLGRLILSRPLSPTLHNHLTRLRFHPQSFQSIFFLLKNLQAGQVEALQLFPQIPPITLPLPRPLNCAIHPVLLFPPLLLELHRAR